MRSLIALSVTAILAVGCSAEAPIPTPAPVQVGWDDLNEMVEAFGYEQGIRQFCEDPAATSQNDFLAELESMAGFDADLLARAKDRAR